MFALTNGSKNDSFEIKSGNTAILIRQNDAEDVKGIGGIQFMAGITFPFDH